MTPEHRSVPGQPVVLLELRLLATLLFLFFVFVLLGFGFLLTSPYTGLFQDETNLPV